MYNYLNAVIEDVKEAIRNDYDFSDFSSREQMEEQLNEDLWVDDSVTGNASGSYYCNSYRAEQALAGNWDILAESLREFGCEVDVLEKGAEWCDVSIRCYLLSQAICYALDEMWEEE